MAIVLPIRPLGLVVGRAGFHRRETPRRASIGPPTSILNRMSVLFKTPSGRRGTVVDMSETDLRTLPNVGPKIAQMLLRLGIERPDDLRGQDAEHLFQRLCDLDGRRHDPCLLDTFRAIVDVANGAPARPWWEYSRERKARATTGSLAR